MGPQVFVIAGPNGAGKSTCAAGLLPKWFPTEKFLNADNIAKVLATDSALEAGRYLLSRLDALFGRGETFAFETTLAARSHVKRLQLAKTAGYRVHLAYIWLSSVELALSRVAVRVQRGGHDVLRPDIERRYRRGLRNFFDLYIALADRWVLCDNSSTELIFVARGKGLRPTTVYDESRFETIQHVARQR